MKMTQNEFEKVMRAALKSLPSLFKKKLANVAIVIEDEKEPRNLLGLYEGYPLTQRTSEAPMPDKITLYKRNLEAMCGGDKERLRLEIKRTLTHEIAHHFGISDKRLDELGLG